MTNAVAGEALAVHSVDTGDLPEVARLSGDADDDFANRATDVIVAFLATSVDPQGRSAITGMDAEY